MFPDIKEYMAKYGEEDGEFLCWMAINLWYYTPSDVKLYL